MSISHLNMRILCDGMMCPGSLISYTHTRRSCPWCLSSAQVHHTIVFKIYILLLHMHYILWSRWLHSLSPKLPPPPPPLAGASAQCWLQDPRSDELPRPHHHCCFCAAFSIHTYVHCISCAHSHVNPTQFSTSGQRRRFCADRYCHRGTIAFPDSSRRFSRSSHVASVYPFQQIFPLPVSHSMASDGLDDVLDMSIEVSDWCGRRLRPSRYGVFCIETQCCDIKDNVIRHRVTAYRAGRSKRNAFGPTRSVILERAMPFWSEFREGHQEILVNQGHVIHLDIYRLPASVCIQNLTFSTARSSSSHGRSLKRLLRTSGVDWVPHAQPASALLLLLEAEDGRRPRPVRFFGRCCPTSHRFLDNTMGIPAACEALWDFRDCVSSCSAFG